MNRPYLWLSIISAVFALSCASCFAGYAPDRTGAGEIGAIVMGVICAVLAVVFWRKRDERMS